MKPKILLLIIAFCGAMSLLSSCFTIGAALVNKAQIKSEPDPEEIGIHEGWYKPKNENVDVRLSLSNNTIDSGEYKGIKTLLFEDGLTELVILKDNRGKKKQYNVDFILSTEILPAGKKKSKGSIIAIGVALDIAILAFAISNADWNFFGDCFLSPDCN